MSSDPGAQATPPAPPTIHEAECVIGGVERGAAITESQAVARRQAGHDIVVCGDDTPANCQLALRIEQRATGPNPKHQSCHEGAGLCALPHWQPRRRPPAGHSFYETHVAVRKAMVKP